jgi:hypothetical protein
MMVRNHDRPLIDRQIVLRRPSDSAVDNRGAALALAVHVRAREERIRDDGVDARVNRSPPLGVPSGLPPTRDRDRDALAAEPQQHLARAPELVEFLQHETNRLLHARIRVELDGTGRPIHQADGQMHPQLATLGLGALGFERALPERRHFEVAHDALEPQEQAIVHQPRVIDAIVIDQHDVRDRSELHQLRPVAIIPGEPRRLECQHGPGRPGADNGEQPLKAGPLGESAAGDAAAQRAVADTAHGARAGVPRRRPPPSDSGPSGGDDDLRLVPSLICQTFTRRNCQIFNRR